MKIAIGPPIEQRLLLRLRVPGADQRGRPRGDRGRDRGASSPRGAPGSARRSRADEARARFEAEDEPYKVELVETRPRARSRSTRRASSPISAAGRTCRTPGRSRRSSSRRSPGAYWRGDETQHAADADLRHGVLQPEGPRRAPRAPRAGASARSPHARARSSTCSTSTSTRRGRRSGTRKGMAICNALEDLRRRENARRGYSR